MDNKQYISLWDNNTENAEYKPLRRPNTNSTIDNKTKHNSEESRNVENPQPTTESKDFNDIVNKSQLRVDAKEWFPSSYTPATPQLVQSAQSRLQKIKFENTTTPEDTNIEETSQNIYFDPVNLDILIQSLIYDPGQFDNLIENFITVLAPHFDDIDVAIKTAELIFQHALEEPSFRYNAARLCCVLDEHYPLFRPKLHILCDKELNSEKQLQGFTLFLAELYMQLRYEIVYGRCLIDSLKKLVSSKKPEDIKSACQALKLAGFSLESKNKDALNEIFNDLERLKVTGGQPLINLIESVLTLRKNNWGRSFAPSSSADGAQEQNGVNTSSSDEEYVFYGPDGQEISFEEQEFLCSNFGDDGDYLGGDSSDPDDLYNPEPEMDKEIQEAFREFVKMNKR